MNCKSQTPCSVHQFSRDDLKSFALVRCHDIFNDYSHDEVRRMPPSIQGAWEVGRDIDAQNVEAHGRRSRTVRTLVGHSESEAE